MDYDVIIPGLNGSNFFAFMSFLWNAAVDFLSSFTVTFYNTGISFTLFECMIGVAIVSIMIYAVARVLQ